MAFPDTDVNTTNLDGPADTLAAARTDVLDLAQKFNALRSFFSTLGKTLVAASTPADARDALGVAPRYSFKMFSGVVAATYSNFAGYSLQFLNGTGASGPAGTYTVPVTGVYMFSFAVQVSLSAQTNTAHCGLFLNGVSVFGTSVKRQITAYEWTNGINPVEHCSVIVSCTALDVVSVRNYGAGPYQSTIDAFSGHLVHPL